MQDAQGIHIAGIVDLEMDTLSSPRLAAEKCLPSLAFVSRKSSSPRSASIVLLRRKFFVRRDRAYFKWPGEGNTDPLCIILQYDEPYPFEKYSPRLLRFRSTSGLCRHEAGNQQCSMTIHSQQARGIDKSISRLNSSRYGKVNGEISMRLFLWSS